MNIRLLFLPLLISCTTMESTPSPAEVAQAVGDMIISSVEFDLVEEDVRYRQEGIYTLYVKGSPTGYQLLSELSGLGEGQYLTWAANSGTLSIHLNGNAVYSGPVTTGIIPERLDYELVRFEHRQKTDIDSGRLEIEYHPDTEELSAVFFWITDEHGTIIKENDLKTIHDGKEVTYLYRPKGTDAWQPPPKLQMPHLTAPLDMADWRYFTGIYMDALLKTADHFSYPEYHGFVEEYVHFLDRNLPAMAAERKNKKLLESDFGHYFRYQLLDDFGTQTLIFLPFSDKAYSKGYVEKALQHIDTEALRLPDGTFCRNTPDSMSVWADDLFMGTALLSRAYVRHREEKYLDEAIFQTRQFDHYLKDPVTGLYWHGYFHRLGKPSSSKWARANGWTMMAKTELLLAMPETHEQREEILDIFRSHAEALKKYQSEDGRWHQVLDNPDTYLETSATAMFTRAFAEGVIQGWLDKSFVPHAVLGWKALNQQIDNTGNVRGIVKGTPVLFSDKAYNRQKTRLNDPRGLGALLYAAIAMDKLFARYPEQK